MTLSGKRVPKLRMIYLYLTGSCNLSCRHCWIDPEFSTKSTGYLPWAELKPIFLDALELGLSAVKITGGEPLLHPEICQILYDLKDIGLSIRLETNGTLLRSRHVKALKDVQADFSISLDGSSAEIHDHLRGVPGAFKRTLKGIETIQSEGIKYQLIMSLYRGNVECLPQMIDFARSLGAGSLKINPITGMARADEMKSNGELLSIQEILQLDKELKCNHNFGESFKIIYDIPPVFKSIQETELDGFGTCGILNILGVLHDGSASICGIGEHIKELDFGDLRHLALRQIWEENEILNNLREGFPGNLGGICGRCIYKNYCMGKCIARNYYDTGTMTGGFQFCLDAFNAGLFPASKLIRHAN
jgi:SynChlorMet cassette radical SAM/SPASM protein ScmF